MGVIHFQAMAAGCTFHYGDFAACPLRCHVDHREPSDASVGNPHLIGSEASHFCLPNVLHCNRATAVAARTCNPSRPSSSPRAFFAPGAKSLGRLAPCHLQPSTAPTLRAGDSQSHRSLRQCPPSMEITPIGFPLRPPCAGFFCRTASDTGARVQRGDRLHGRDGRAAVPRCQPDTHMNSSLSRRRRTRSQHRAGASFSVPIPTTLPQWSVGYKKAVGIL